MVGPDPHNNSSHYRDSRLCITAFDPNGQRTQVETPVRPPLLPLCTVVSPTSASWALSGPHLGAVYEVVRSGSSQKRRNTIKSHTSNRGSLTACKATAIVLTTPTSLGPPIVGPTQHTLHNHHLPPSDVMERLVAQDPQHHCGHCTGL